MLCLRKKNIEGQINIHTEGHAHTRTQTHSANITLITYSGAEMVLIHLVMVCGFWDEPRNVTVLPQASLFIKEKNW